MKSDNCTVYASIYLGVFEQDKDGTRYIDSGCGPWQDMFSFETDDLDMAKRMFAAITTNEVPSQHEGNTYYVEEGYGMRDKSIGTYLHHKYPWADDICAHFNIEACGDEDYYDCVYEVLYHNDSDISNYDESTLTE